MKGALELAKTITVFNQKGGVGKTTTVVNLSLAMAMQKKRVLVIDMDPQANSTSGLGIEKNREYMVYDFIMDKGREVNIVNRSKNLDLVPSGGDLAGIEMELTGEANWQLKLKESIESLEDNYDYIIIDCPPSLGILSLMSLSASDGILIPVQCEYYALEGVSQLMETINLVKDNFNPKIDLTGVLLTMYDGRNNLSLQVVEEVKNVFKSKVFKTMIPRNVRLAEAPSFGQSILEYDEKSKGAQAYRALAKEIIKRG